MSFIYETQGTNTYLVYQVSADDSVDSMSLGMLTNNKIRGLAHTVFTQIDKTKFLKFNVSSKISVNQFFNGPVNKKRLLGVFNGIVEAMLSSEEYMIDYESILLDLDYMYADVSSCETVLICLPIEGYSNGAKLGEFFKNIMFNTQFDQTENCDHVAKIMNYLNSSPLFSLEEFQKVLQTVDTVDRTEIKKYEDTSLADKNASVKPKNNVSTACVSDSSPSDNREIKETKINRAPSNLGGVPQSKMSGGVMSTVQKGVTIAPVLQPERSAVSGSKKEKKSGLFSGLFKTDSNKDSRQKSLNSVNSNKSSPYPVPGMEIGGMAIPGQPTPPPVAKPAAQAQPVRPAAPMPNKVAQPQPVPVQPVRPAVPVQPVQAVPQSRPMNFGETTVLNAGGNFGETTVLNVGMIQQLAKVQPYLIRSKNNERIELNKPVFRIGKERSYVDYFIGDNTAISRSHANIISRDGSYFVVDTNSTNHTYVNGTMIQSNVETEISDGAKLRFANEDFEFKLV